MPERVSPAKHALTLIPPATSPDRSIRVAGEPAAYPTELGQQQAGRRRRDRIGSAYGDNGMANLHLICKLYSGAQNIQIARCGYWSSHTRE